MASEGASQRQGAPLSSRPTARTPLLPRAAPAVLRRMRAFAEPLPIDDVLPRLVAALDAGTRAVLVAPPGAGKTTRVPLALLDEAFAAAKGKIVVLEPRRLAARAAAARMASSLGEAVGETVGLRVRLQSLVSARTRIEVVTEGVFARHDPRRSGARRRRGGAVRRIPRALARRRSRPGAGARRAGGPCARTCACSSCRRRSTARASRRLMPGATLIESEGRAFAGRDALCRPRPRAAHRRPSRAGDARRARRGARLDPRLPARPGRDPARRGAARRARARSRRRHRAALRRDGRARPGPRRRAGAARAGARSCWRPRSPRPR